MSPRVSLAVAVLLLLVSMPAQAGVLGVPDGYTPDKRWPLQDNPDPALTSKAGYFLVHSGDIGVRCTEKLEENLKSLVARYNIDLNRIYGTGFSRGGHELLEQAWNVPHLFAAGAAVCNDLRY
jgi:dienelactone hydrolase